MARKRRSFVEAREFVRKLGLRSSAQWKAYCRKGEKPSDIPSRPDLVYEEFEGYGDWLGTGNVRNQDRSYRPFNEAREYVRRLGLKTKREWEDYCKGGGKPKDIPRTPRQVYGSEFQGYGDWLGTGNASRRYYKPRSFEEPVISLEDCV